MATEHESLRKELAIASEAITRAKSLAARENHAVSIFTQRKMFQSLELSVEFLARLHDKLREKQNIADWLLNPDNSRGLLKINPDSMFVESGTTFFYLIQQYLSDEEQIPEYTTTNHKLVETAWAKYSAVFSLPGRFLEKYMGDFPFGSVPNEMSKDDESEGYEMILRHTRGTDAVLATCSRFSFVAGPLVGSRENALTKCAMYQGRSKSDAEFLLIFTFDKLIPMLSTEIDLGFSEPNECIVVTRQPEDLQQFSSPSTWHADWYKGKHAYASQLVDSWNLRASEWLSAAPGVRVIVALPDSRIHQDSDEYLLYKDKSEAAQRDDDRQRASATKERRLKARRFLADECKRATEACRTTPFGKRVFEIVSDSVDSDVVEICISG